VKKHEAALERVRERGGLVEDRRADVRKIDRGEDGFHRWNEVKKSDTEQGE
jgi:hypothetical protein